MAAAKINSKVVRSEKLEAMCIYAVLMLDYLLHIIRYRRFDCKSGTQGRMRKRNLIRMKHHPRRPQTVSTGSLPAGIQIVTDDRMIHVFEVNPYLMRPPGLRIHLDDTQRFFTDGG